MLPVFQQSFMKLSRFSAGRNDRACCCEDESSKVLSLQMAAPPFTPGVIRVFFF